MLARLFALVAAMFLFACSGEEGTDSGAGGQSSWRFAIEEIQGSVQHRYATRFAELVEQKTGGEVSIDVYPYGTLGTSTQLTELIRSGAIEFAFASPGHLGSVIPEVQVFSIHYLFPRDQESIHQVLSDSPTLYGPLAEAYEEKGLRLVALIPEGWMVWTANKAIRSPADFKGVKIRTMVSPLLLKAYEAYGANPTPMAYSEVYSALQLNMIDAQVNPVFAIEEMGFHEQQSHMIFGYHLPFVASMVTNPAFFDELPEKHRRAVMGAKKELDDYILEQQRELNRKRLKKIREEGGTEIVQLSPEEVDAFRQAAAGIPERYVELAGERGRRILEGLRMELERASAAPATE